MEKSKNVLTTKQEDVWKTLTDPFWGKITNNTALLVHVERSQKQKKVTNQLGDYLTELATKMIHTKGFDDYTFNEDMVQDAMRQMLLAVMNFKLDKSHNVFAYLTQVCHGAMIQTIHKERKHRALQEELLEKAELGLL